jgi:hypothetical protein
MMVSAEWTQVADRRTLRSKDVSQMAVLFFLAFALLVAALAPVLGTDTSDARSEDAKDERGWWPAGPTAHPRPRY